MTDKRATLLKLNQNLNILKEREAKFAGSAPLELLNQIDDHHRPTYRRGKFAYSSEAVDN